MRNIIANSLRELKFSQFIGVLEWYMRINKHERYNKHKKQEAWYDYKTNNLSQDNWFLFNTKQGDSFKFKFDLVEGVKRVTIFLNSYRIYTKRDDMSGSGELYKLDILYNNHTKLFDSLNDRADFEKNKRIKKESLLSNT